MRAFELAVLGGLVISPAVAQTPGEEAAEAQFQAIFTQACYLDDPVMRSTEEFFPKESWALEWEDEFGEPSPATLHQFFCSSGAYNVQMIYFLDDGMNGPMPVAFAVPQFDVDYVDDDIDGPVEAIRQRGFETQIMLTNPSFDPDNQTIVSTANWRGLGDASSSGRWVFEQGSFVLKTFDVDASYDGEINPERIVEYK